MANKEEGKSEMVSGKCNSANVKRKKSLTNIDSLPDELVFDILVHLPAEDIYNGAMLVCWKWYRMIRTHDFIYSHLHHSTPGLLLKSYNCPSNDSFFVAMRQNRIEVSKFSYNLRDVCWGSCNGLILEDYNTEGAIRITNPAIKQRFEIPPFPDPKRNYHRCSIAYSAASMEYKVVRSCYIRDGSSFFTHWDILTVGVDETWRYVCTQHLPKDILAARPFMTEGFIHWPVKSTHILTLNVETEVMTQIPVPQGCVERVKRYLSAGKSVSLFVTCGKLSFEIWDMKPETGEWTKLYEIDLEDQKYKFEHVRRKENQVPVVLMIYGWLKYHEVLVLCFTHSSRGCIAYNVVTREIDFFELYNIRRYNIHTNSLVGLAGSEFSFPSPTGARG